MLIYPIRGKYSKYVKNSSNSTAIKETTQFKMGRISK